MAFEALRLPSCSRSRSGCYPGTAGHEFRNQRSGRGELRRVRPLREHVVDAGYQFFLGEGLVESQVGTDSPGRLQRILLVTALEAAGDGDDLDVRPFLADGRAVVDDMNVVVLFVHGSPAPYAGGLLCSCPAVLPLL